MPYGTAVTAATSAARTTTGQSAAFAADGGRTVAVLAAVTAVSGTTPSMTLSLEWSDDGTTWFAGDPADAMTAMTATGNKAKSFTVKAAFCRLVWTLTGTTPSFTFRAALYFSG